MIVGISGASCSGKTSLAKAIAEMIGAPTLHLDQHFIAEADRPEVNGYPSFEQPHQYDAAALLEQVRETARQHEHVVVEGFLLFTYPGFLEICDRKVHLDVPHDTLAERRARRNGATGDVKGGRIKLADTAWAAHGREEWERFGAMQAALPGIEILRPYAMLGAPSARDLGQGLVDVWGIRIG